MKTFFALVALVALAGVCSAAPKTVADPAEEPGNDVAPIVEQEEEVFFFKLAKFNQYGQFVEFVETEREEMEYVDADEDDEVPAETDDDEVHSVSKRSAGYHGYHHGHGHNHGYRRRVVYTYRPRRVYHYKPRRVYTYRPRYTYHNW